MNSVNRTFTADDAQSLADKLAQFDASLTPRERAIFRHRILTTMETEDDVEGHRMEMRWTAGPEGLFRTWVEIDETSADSRTTVDPSRWNTKSSQSEPNRAAQGLELQTSENQG